ncbi:BREX-1 system adenine-specific DNA-methyltransferase PglX [Flavobacterium magnesitis]|uniref:BREX-1 system adenine-specific DNA-methyltransferase PglX n=1 Tax=Flavobacterium magnesitis TaxID=3138077 RepID=UPI00358E4EDC
MNTNNIKSFAKQARLILIEGVKQRLLYWGFDENGNTTAVVNPTMGGYEFRGDIFTDESVPPKWNKLKTKLNNKQAVQDTIEEAAYTWFNRIMAIKILEKRGYISPTLDYVTDLKIPQIVQEAKRGQHQLKQQKYITLLQEYLLEDKEEQALGLLLTRLCNNDIVIHDVFGRIDDYTEILLPTNLLARNGIIDLLNSYALEEDQYQEVELIGWLYQFYISDKKDEVFKGFKTNKKARPEDIPAATQIFTPKWIVKYMVENTVGKIYLDYDKNSDLKSEMKYLVEASVNDQGLMVNEKSDTINNSPLTINNLEELTLIDPASGSGHILVTGFELLFKMYREQGYTAKNAVISILQNNIYGLDIDDRAMQLARFAVLLKAAEFYPEILNASDSNPLVLPHIYSFPAKYHFQLEDLQNFLSSKGGNFVAELKEALVLLNEGKNIGAALKLELAAEAHTFISNQYQNWNSQYQAGTLDILQQDLWNNLKPFLEVLLVMTKKYTAVVANPPYLGPRNMNAALKDFVTKKYPSSKSDLFAVFIEISLNLNMVNGKLGIINQESWLFNSSYKELRNNIVKKYQIESLLHLGTRAFDELSGEKVRSVTFVLSNSKSFKKGNYYKLTEYNNSNAKNLAFLKKENQYYNVDQKDFLKIDGTPFAYWITKTVLTLFKENKKLSDYSEPRKGNSTSDNDRFLKLWFEISITKQGLGYNEVNTALEELKKWIPYNKGGGTRKWYGNNEYLIDWSNNGNEIRKIKTAVVTNEQYYMKPGLTWSAISSKTFGIRYFDEGFIFDNNGCCLFELNDNRDYLAALLNSKVFFHIIGQLNPALAFHPGDVKKFPVIHQEIDESISKKNLKLSKKDWDSRETSWDFEQSPLLNESVSLKEAYQKWQDSVTLDFFQLHENEEELNRIFIDIYGLQEELTPEVALKDITILQEELDRNALEQLEPVFRAKGANAVQLPIKKDEVISQFLSYSIGVFMGRYRLDKPGLHIAHPNPTEEELAPYVIASPNIIPSQVEGSLTIHNSQFTIDEDAIIPLMGSECAFPDDALVRIKNLIHTVWSEKSQIENSNFINECLGMDLDKWLTEKFWGLHTSMYKKKPIYWLFSSNPKKPQAAAFKVLVYMHRMDKFTVSKIQRNYLHPHQEWIRLEIEKLLREEANLSKTELKRLEKLRTWEIECRDYNEVLKTLALNEVVFDLDDGVTVNYEKFEGAVAKI